MWSSDFAFSNGRLLVLKTGARLPFSRALVGEALSWAPYYLAVRLAAAWARATRPDAPRVWFTPDTPRPWYMVWTAAAWAGIRVARLPAEADAAFFFDDATWSASPAGGPALRFNHHCTDVSKSHVAAVFEQAFGYPLTVDPARWAGPAVEKSEGNGLHDGRVVACPRPQRAGRTYQRLIDTVDDGWAHDLRTSCVGGRPIVVFHKRKPPDRRFGIHNADVRLREPEGVFSADEIAAIGRFCAALGLDWGGLDILRDRADGRIYIVDANKTDMGPAIALPWLQKLQATRRLADALLTMIDRPPR